MTVPDDVPLAQSIPGRRRLVTVRRKASASPATSPTVRFNVENSQSSSSTLLPSLPSEASAGQSPLSRTKGGKSKQPKRPMGPTQDEHGNWVEHTVLGDVEEFEKSLFEYKMVHGDRGEAALAAVRMRAPAEQGGAQQAGGGGGDADGAGNYGSLEAAAANLDFDEEDMPPDVQAALYVAPDNSARRAIRDAFRACMEKRQACLDHLEAIRAARREATAPPPVKTGTSGGTAGKGAGGTAKRVGAGSGPASALPSDTDVESRRHERALAKFAIKQREWEQVRETLALRTGKSVDELAMERLQRDREMKETLARIDAAIPFQLKVSGDQLWTMSLRDNWVRSVPVGNIFSGLFCPQNMTPPPVEVVRRPADVGAMGSSVLKASLLASQGKASPNSPLARPHLSKGVTARSLARVFADGSHLSRKQRELHKALATLLPHEPQLEGMEVVGYGLENELAAAAADPVTLAEVESHMAAVNHEEWARMLARKTAEDDVREASMAAAEAEALRAAAANVQVQGPSITLSTHRLCLTCPANGLSRGVVELHNSGSTALFYQWQRLQWTEADAAPKPDKPAKGASSQGGSRGPSSQGARPSPIQTRPNPDAGARDKEATAALQETMEALSAGHYFYLSNQSGMVLPGDSVLFSFTFKSPSAGMFMEKWALTTEPALKGNVQPTLLLKGVALPEDNTKLRRRQLDASLRHKEMMHAVEDVIEHAFKKLRTPRRSHADAKAHMASTILFTDAHGLLDPPTPAESAQARASAGNRHPVGEGDAATQEHLASLRRASLDFMSVNARESPSVYYHEAVFAEMEDIASGAHATLQHLAETGRLMGGPEPLGSERHADGAGGPVPHHNDELVELAPTWDGSVARLRLLVERVPVEEGGAELRERLEAAVAEAAVPPDRSTLLYRVVHQILCQLGEAVPGISAAVRTQVEEEHDFHFPPPVEPPKPPPVEVVPEPVQEAPPAKGAKGAKAPVKGAKAKEAAKEPPSPPPPVTPPEEEMVEEVDPEEAEAAAALLQEMTEEATAGIMEQVRWLVCLFLSLFASIPFVWWHARLCRC
eukprot:jgi/Mesvir1/15497/Mv20028-RA.1